MSDQAYFYLLEGKSYRLAASCGFSPEAEALLKQHTIVPGRNTLVARISLEGRVIHIEDVLADPEYTYSEAQKLIGFRTPAWRTAVARGHTYRRDDTLAKHCTTVHPEAARPRVDLCRSGSDRDRERATVRRSAGAHRGLAGVLAAAYRHRRRAQGHQPVDLQFANRARYAGRVSRPAVRSGHGFH